MDRRRRALLQAIAALGLAACTPRRTAVEPSATAASPRAAGTSTPRTPTPAPAPTPSAPPSATPSSASPTPTAEARVRPVVSRGLLDLPAPRPGGRPHEITGLMLHHTGMPVVAPAQARARFASITRQHRDAGFVDAAYHWGIDAGGTVYELRDEAVAGETFTGYDPAGWLLVVCDGNYDVSTPTEAVLDAVADVFAAGAARHGVAPATLVGHRDRAATACPGDSLQARLPDLVAMVETRLAEGGVTLTVTDDPDLLP